MPALREKAVTLLSSTTVSLAGTGQTTLFTVPTGKRCVLNHAVLVGAATASTSVMTLGQVGALTDFLEANTLSGIAALNDAIIMRPAPSTTPLKSKSYAAGTVIQADVTTASGSAGNTLYLFGFLY